ncbi:dethiobiotin synthase [Desulforegula conservatrix]|uniref:dethiobiotin synthase n=1 Tax=Desulforegula conservatrix TaxID=153026 RepID=UPI000412DE29|nr:dethiobiotin synthase [Desulforegula conservatrix]
MILPEKIFITGTDTGIGKTFVSAVITAGRNGYYWKPIQSGLEDMTDTEWVRSVTGLPDTHFLKEAYRLNSPLSPHISAELDGISIDPDLINLPNNKELLVIEGAGGVMVPLNADFVMLDLMRKFCLPVLVVARSGLGTINHTLLTLDTLKRSGLEIIGVVMNGPVNPENRESIERLGQVRVVAEIEPVPVINKSVLIEIYERFFNG